MQYCMGRGGGHACAGLRPAFGTSFTYSRYLQDHSPKGSLWVNDAEIPDLASSMPHGDAVSIWTGASALVRSRPLRGRRGPHRRPCCARWMHAGRSEANGLEWGWTSSRIGRVAAVACSLGLLGRFQWGRRACARARGRGRGARGRDGVVGRSAWIRDAGWRFVIQQITISSRGAALRASGPAGCERRSL